jgi:hypothetical protein
MAVPQSHPDGLLPGTMTVRRAVWNPGAPTSRRYVPAPPSTRHVEEHGVVSVITPDTETETDAPVTGPPVEPTSTEMPSERHRHRPAESATARRPEAQADVIEGDVLLPSAARRDDRA